MNNKKSALTLTLFITLFLGTQSLSAQNFFKWFTKNKGDNKQAIIQSEAYFIEACKEYNLGAYAKSLPLLEKALNIQPQNAAIHFKISECYARLSNITQAIVFSKKSLELNPENKYYYVLLAELYENKKMYNEAIDVLERLIKTNNHSDEYFFDLASLYIETKKLPEAITTLDKAETHYGVSQEITSQKQQLYLKLNKLDKVIEEGQKLIAAFPSEIIYKIDLAEILISNNKTKEAEDIINQVLANDPNEPLAQLLYCDIYKELGDTKKSELMLEKAFANPRLSVDDKIDIVVNMINSNDDPSSKKLSLKLSEIMVNTHHNDAKGIAVYADMLLFNNKKNESLNEYLKALKINSGTYKIWQQVFSLDTELNLPDSLLKHTSQALELYPNQGTVWYFNGTGYTMKKDYKNAAYSLEEAKKLSSDKESLILQINAQLGDIYNNLKNYPKSDAAYEEVLSKDANNIHVLNNYSYFLSLRKEKLEYAKNLCKKVIDLYPDEPTYLDTYGWILYVMKDYEGAKVYLEKAMNKIENGAITEHYGDVLFQLGNKEKALELWKIAKKQGETSDLIDKKIADKTLYE